MHIGVKAIMAALTAVAIVIPIRSGYADAFSDDCVAAGGGMFKAEDCTCIGGKATGDDRADLIAFFKASAAEQKGGPKPDENDPQMQRGFAALNKHGEACMK